MTQQKVHNVTRPCTQLLQHRCTMQCIRLSPTKQAEVHYNLRGWIVGKVGEVRTGKGLGWELQRKYFCSKIVKYRAPKMVCTWLRDICSCSSLPVLPGPAWVLLSKIYKPYLGALYSRHLTASFRKRHQLFCPSI